MTIALHSTPRCSHMRDTAVVAPSEARMMPLDPSASALSRRSPDAPARAPLADMVAATRSLLNAWDRAMSSWRADPVAPVRGAPLTPSSGFEHSYFAPSTSAPLREAGSGLRGPVGRTPVDDTRLATPSSVTTTHSLTAQMLDGFQLWLDGEPVHDLPQGKARALLQVLLLQRRRPISRKRLCAMFWPDADADSARNNLNVTLHRLRRALGKVNLLRHSDAGYQIWVPGEVWLDVEHFNFNADIGRSEELAGHTGLAITWYEAAAALYHADLQDAGELEPALAADCQALRDRHNEVLDRLAHLREQVGDLHGCLRTTLRHLAQDECNEGAHQRLMRCYARLGQPQLAERQYRACVTVLRLQLGLHPRDDTTALCRRIARREGV
jgi:DNA-binding SARP family transcriptional activator